ncbi:MAG: GGDEF domain-containing protein [Aestuariibacter sp.]
MENIVSYYDNTIKDSVLKFNEHQPLLSDKDKHDFVIRMSATLDIQHIADMLFQELSTRLSLTGLTIQDEAEEWPIGKTADKYQKTLTISHSASSVSRIQYRFSRTLSLREWQLLRDYHQCVKHPVKNAIAFFTVQKLATKDKLTGLGNRLSFDESVNKLVSQCQRSQESLSMLLIDLDKFKPVNDVFGHSEGDRVLIEVAKAIASSLRAADHAFRFGGDEFCCIAMNASLEDNQLIVKRINQQIEANPLLQKHGVSCSFGIATLNKDETQLDLFNRADKALYQAKDAGRDCAIIAA